MMRDPGAEPPLTGAAERLSPRVRRVLAPNPGPFTDRGTCSYILGAGEVAILDPGPAAEAHVAALLEEIRGERLAAILVTHTHRDHSPAAELLRARTGAPVLGCALYAPRETPAAAGPSLDASHDRAYAPDRVLRDGERLAIGDAEIEVVATPGHTRNHLCYALREEFCLFTGDHVMGWSTTVVAPPDGQMRAYMESLEKLRARDETVYWPAHGGPVRDPQRYLRVLEQHRLLRERTILARLDAGLDAVPAIVESVYEAIDRRLWPAAAMNVLAHMEDLVERGIVVADGPTTLAARYRRA
jgi:glyoxylase-like metal-dependent hydrolase (beta-lactamase superfamily II)